MNEGHWHTPNPSTGSVPKPLAGRRVLVPRGGKWGDGVSASLRSYGAAPVIAPLINFAPAETPELLAAALARLQAGVYEWLVVTSATTVDVLVGNGIRPIPATRIAAVGETTAAALTLAGYHVDFVPDEIIDRFCILGTADEHIAKLQKLRDIGVTQFAGYLQHDNKEETMRVYGETVIPALSEHLTAKK